MQVSGVQPGVGDRDRLFEYVDILEERGKETIWIGESWGRSSVPTIVQLLERTETVDVCAGIFNVYTRTPALIAMTATTLADLSDGRFRLGLGTSGPAVIENFHGVPFDAPLRRTREYIEVIRGYLGGDRVSYDGHLFQLSGFALDVETPHDVPIYVASMGEKNRELTGAFADGWIPLSVPHTGLGDALEAIERGADRRARTMAGIDVAPWIPTCISETDPDAAREHVRSLLAFYIGAMGDYYAASASRFGYADEAEAIQAGWEADRQSGAEAAVPDDMLDAFGACGTPSEADASIRSFVRAGADSPVAYLPARWASEELIRETLTLL